MIQCEYELWTIVAPFAFQFIEEKKSVVSFLNQTSLLL